MPSLIPDEMIKALYDRLESNKGKTHGPRLGNKYLLGGNIYCADCGATLTGRPEPKRGRLMYQHQKDSKSLKKPIIKRQCPNYTRWEVKADQIETAVIAQLYHIFGDIEDMEKAMMKAIPKYEEVERMRKEKMDLEKRLATLSLASDRIVDAIAKGIISDDKAKKRMDAVVENENIIKEEIARINAQTSNIPTEKQIKINAKALLESVIRWVKSGSGHFERMTWDNKRKLIEKVFKGKDASGKPFGVYIKKDGPNRSYEIRGNFTVISGTLPMPEWERNELLEITSDFGHIDDIDNNISKSIDNCGGS
jgi:hypothetical protein